MTENPKPISLAALHVHLRNQLEGAAYNVPDITDYAAVAAWGSMLAGLAQALAAVRVELDRERELAACPLPVEQLKPDKVRLVWNREDGFHYLAPAGAGLDGAYYSTSHRYAFRYPGGRERDRRVPVASIAHGLRVITDMSRVDGYECDDHPDAAPVTTDAPTLPPALRAEDGWIPWGGGECPCPDWPVVEYELRDGYHVMMQPDDLLWEHNDDPGDIIAYRRPR